MVYRVAVVGTGAPDQPDRYAMAYRHAQAYDRLEECELVACADIVRENAVAFARRFDLPTREVYEDYETMLSEVEPDVVSVCTPPKTHAEIVMGCAESGLIDAIHCEKPMAGTWKGCREMVATCDRTGVQLTFNHQRRFAVPYRRAKTLLDDGRIGTLQRIEIGGQDLLDYGTHLFDMSGYMTDQTPVEWVLAQVDCRDPSRKYGLYQESQALAWWRYKSGVDGFASTGEEGVIRCQLRLVGTDGVIEVGHEDGPPARVRVYGSAWEQIETGRDGVWRQHPHPLDRLAERVPIGPDRLFSEPTYVDRALADVVQALDADGPSTLSAANALQATEIIFGAWESARRGQRVRLPLEIDGNPLQEMVDGDTRTREMIDRTTRP